MPNAILPKCQSDLITKTIPSPINIKLRSLLFTPFLSYCTLGQACLVIALLQPCGTLVKTPLLENMTLFWHSHFATNGDKVKSARLMQQHIRLLRSQALNSFRTLLGGISRDPAVLVWLDADANRKALPNENFVKPLMETFTLGYGHGYYHQPRL